MSDDNETILALLEEKANFHSRETERYRSAIRILRGEPETGTRPKTRLQFAPAENPAARRRKVDNPMASTQAMIERVLAEVGSLPYKELTNKMLEAGWITESVTPSNTVRTALGRLAARGIVERTEGGLFAAPASSDEDQ